jgi:TolA-binding protein
MFTFGRTGGRVKISRAGIVLLIIFISSGSLLLSGCSVTRPVGDFFGRQYVNTVSYFNTFYNAKHLYDEALFDLQEGERRHQQQRREGQYEIPQQVRQKFNEVIEKCSRLLHQYPTSRYADDAVFMIGQSYYHMRQNVQAERKFLELLSEFPGSRHLYEAQLLLAKTQLRMNKQNEAYIALQNLIERLESSRERDIIAQTRIQLGEIEKQANNPERAVNEFAEAVAVARDRSIRTEARFRLANMYYTLGDFDRAFEEFGEVISDRPTGESLFESHIARAKILTRNEQYDEALDLLDDLLTDLRLADYIPRIELQAAHVYRDQGFIEKAIDQYVYVDTTHIRTSASTEAQYSLATIYKNIFGDFKISKEYYEKVSRATPPSDLTRSAWAINDHLTRYWRHKNEIVRLDSVIIAQREELRFIDEQSAAGAVSESDTVDIVEDSFDEISGSPVTEVSPDELQEQITAKTDDLVRNYSELAGLFYMELEQPDSAVFYYSRLAHNFPESPYTPQALYALAELVRNTAEQGLPASGIEILFDTQFIRLNPAEQREYVYHYLIDHYPDSDFALEAKRILGMEIQRAETDPLEELYLRAEDILIDGNHEEALRLFEYIAHNNGESEYIPKAWYAIGWIYENIYLVSDSAAVYYQRIVDKHPETRLASAVRDKLTAWSQHLAEEQQKMSEAQATEVTEEPDGESEREDQADEAQGPRGIPIARPTDTIEHNEKPDTIRIPEQNEN